MSLSEFNDIPEFDPYWEFDKNNHFRPKLNKGDFYKLTGDEFIIFIFQELSKFIESDEHALAKGIRLSYGQKCFYYLSYAEGDVSSSGFARFYFDGYGPFVPTIIKALQHVGDIAMASLIKKAEIVYRKNKENIDGVREGDSYNEIEEFSRLEVTYERINRKTRRIIGDYVKKHPNEFCVDEEGNEFDPSFSGDYRDLYPHGKIKEYFQAVNGKVVGENNKYYENGQLKDRILYRKGKPTGEREEYYENGILKFKITRNKVNGYMKHEWFYEDGKPQKIKHTSKLIYARIGEFKEWYENGQLKESGEYSSYNNLHGPFVQFYEDGVLERKIEYTDGKCISAYYNPRPTTEELIEICFVSEDQAAISKAATQLKQNEGFYIEFREAVMERLEQKVLPFLTEEDKQRVFLIIRGAELDISINRRNIMGKHYDEIIKDAAFFRKIADRANDILRKMDK